MSDKPPQIVFRNASVIDGTGAAPFVADVAISDDRITAIGALREVRGGVEIDATNRILSPGFIDTHTHDDCALLANPTMDMKASQGVTTVVAGNCGVSLAPLVADYIPPPLDLVRDHSWYRFETFAHYLDELDQQPAAVNAVCLVGHMTLRVAHMPTPAAPRTAKKSRQCAVHSMRA